jgi:hypothetical protein
LKKNAGQPKMIRSIGNDQGPEWLWEKQGEIALAVVKDTVEGIPSRGGDMRREWPNVITSHHVRIEETLQCKQQQQQISSSAR